MTTQFITTQIKYQTIIGDAMRDFILHVELEIESQEPNSFGDSSDDFYGYTDILSCNILECVEVLDNGEQQNCMAAMVGFSKDDLKEIEEIAFNSVRGESK